MNHTATAEDTGSRNNLRRMFTFFILLVVAQLIGGFIERWSGNSILGDAIQGGLFGLIFIIIMAPESRRTVLWTAFMIVFGAGVFSIVGYVFDSFIFPGA